MPPPSSHRGRKEKVSRCNLRPLQCHIELIRCKVVQTLRHSTVSLLLRRVAEWSYDKVLLFLGRIGIGPVFNFSKLPLAGLPSMLRTCSIPAFLQLANNGIDKLQLDVTRWAAMGRQSHGGTDMSSTQRI